MTRVCMVAFTHYPTDPRVRREAEALVERGDTVEVISLRENDRQRVAELDGVRMLQPAIRRYRGSNPVIYMLRYLQFFVTTFLWLAFLHLKDPYDVIQVHTMPDFMVFAAALPRLSGAKVVLDVHDLMPELYRSKFGLEKSHPLIRLITWMERRSVAFAHRALAVHVSHLNALVGHGNPREKFDVLLNLPDPRIFSREKGRSTRSKDGLQLIYHGTMGKLHGLRVALHALSYLHEEIEGVELQLFGDGDDVPHLRALVEELCLRDCVAISHGRVPMESLIPMILGADIGIVPILYDDFTRYMLPTKLLEYVALGIPVICSRTETIEAYFDENMVRYVEPGNARELAAAIADLYRHPRERRRMVANAEKFNRLYSWEQAKNLYYRMMDDLIGKPEVRYEGENHGRGTGRNRETVAPTDRSTPSSHRRRP